MRRMAATLPSSSLFDFIVRAAIMKSRIRVVIFFSSRVRKLPRLPHILTPHLRLTTGASHDVGVILELWLRRHAHITLVGRNRRVHDAGADGWVQCDSEGVGVATDASSSPQ